ncbi:MAG: hypothetical protein ABIJ96_07130, partial [Elusimicrobiota bacterium]
GGAGGGTGAAGGGGPDGGEHPQGSPFFGGRMNYVPAEMPKEFHVLAKNMPGYNMNPFNPAGAAGGDMRKQSAGSMKTAANAGGAQQQGRAKKAAQPTFSTSGGSSGGSAPALTPMTPQRKRTAAGGTPSAPAAKQKYAPQSDPRLRSSAASSGQPVGAENAEEELNDDYWTTKLSPARHIQSGHADHPQDPKPAGPMGALIYLLNILALLAAIYVYKFTQLPYVLGLKRRDED